MKIKQILALLFSCCLVFWQCEGPPGADGAGVYLSVSPDMVSLPVGESTTITVVTDNGDDGNYSWSSADDAVATVSNGLVTGVSEGSTFISVVGNDTKANGVVIVNVTPEERSTYSYLLDIQPMFVSDNFWFPGANACTRCHFSNNEDAGSKHAMDLGSLEGMLKGADYPPGEPLFGESSVGATDYNWNDALLRARLRDNRMPQNPAWEFRLDESNRDGPDIDISSGHASVKLPHSYGDTVNAVGLIQAWVEQALSAVPTLSDSTTTFTYSGISNLIYEEDIKPFFTEPDMWFPNSQPCIECHFSNDEENTNSHHALDLRSFKGMISGADIGEASLFNSGGTNEQKDWEHSRLKHRLRDNRMPPNSPFLLSEDNRDGPDVWDAVAGENVSAVDLIGRWVDAGTPE